MEPAFVSATTVATTKSVKTSHIFDWTIEDFEQMCPATTISFEAIKSPEFHVKHKGGSESWWSVSLYGRHKEIGFVLNCNRTEPDGFRTDGFICNYIMCMGNEAHPTLHQMEHTETFKNGVYSWWEHGRFISMKSLHSRRNELLQGGKLRVRAIITIFEKAPATVVSVPALPSPKRTLELKAARLASEESTALLEAMYNDSKFSDVTFYCGDEEFKAHKNVLACRSEVFLTMFTTDMDEAASSSVQIEDLDPTTLKFILRYAYTAKVNELDPDLALTVIHGAEKYGLDELKHFCFDTLLECINEENAGTLAVAAYSYRAKPEVTNSVRQYLDRDFLSRVRSDVQFRQLVMQYPLAFYSQA